MPIRRLISRFLQRTINCSHQKHSPGVITKEHIGRIALQPLSCSAIVLFTGCLCSAAFFYVIIIVGRMANPRLINVNDFLIRIDQTGDLSALICFYFSGNASCRNSIGITGDNVRAAENDDVKG